ncbi:MAG TPA: DUF1761 domain-containing protein [Candidatus Saccharimonadales bacterium]|nr:DUF1761 domain-containing protein [Candidatus Saccharimonadales bacterium]
MNIAINYWGVLLAAVSSMVVGSLWYMPGTFGKAWMKMTGIKMDQMRGARKPALMLWMYGSVFAASLVTAYILAAVTFLAQQFTHDSYMQDALTVALWLWLGFTAARMYVHDTFEMRRKKLTLLNASHELATVLLMAVILGWLHP